MPLLLPAVPVLIEAAEAFIAGVDIGKKICDSLSSSGK